VRLSPFAAAALVVALPAGSFGWGREGHQLIARIAFQHLDKKAQTAIGGLLDPGETLESISTWADEVRPKRNETATWHYINIPLSERTDWKKYCPASGCVIETVIKMEQRLRNASLPRAERREALFFFVHMLSDLHQPLHVGDNGDRGGNDIKTVYRNYAGNLHSLWDTSLILGYKETDPAMFGRLARPASSWEKWRSAGGSPVDWAWQSHAVSREVAYPNLPKGQPAQLGELYAAAAKPHVEKQLRRAGLRLAAALNKAFAR
jgi:hypothetical protein